MAAMAAPVKTMTPRVGSMTTSAVLLDVVVHGAGGQWDVSCDCGGCRGNPGGGADDRKRRHLTVEKRIFRGIHPSCVLA
jgi:hypothetical protein